MSVLDTFYLLFTSNAKEAQGDTVALDKQLDDLAKKGKKRSDDENKRYAELKKQRKEQLDQLKDQRREADNLSDAFQTMIASAVGAVGAYTSFGALKSGLADVNKLNASLVVLRDTYHLNAQELKGYAAALDLAGGNGQDFVTFVTQQAQYSRQNRLPIVQPGEWVKRLREAYRQPFGESYLQSIGANPLVELLNKSPDEFAGLQRKGFEKAQFDESQQKAALEYQEAVQGTKDALNSLNTAINTNLTPTIKWFNEQLQSIAAFLQQHPTLGLAAEGGYAGVKGLEAAGATYFGIKALRWAGRGIKGLLGSGAGEAVLEAEAATAPVEAGEAASGIGLPAAIATAVGTAVVAGLAYWWGRRSDSSSPAPDMPPARPAGGTARGVYDFWVSRGYSPAAAAGWAANAQAESGFNPFATNGTHFGIYQWSRDRRQKILAATGIDVANASRDDQLKAADWEARTMGLGPSAFTGNAAASAALISNRFEVPALTSSGLAAEAAHRAQIASSYGTIPLSPSGDTASGRAVNIKIDEIKIETQATDASGIAAQVGTELRNQIRIAMSNFDDGVNY